MLLRWLRLELQGIVAKRNLRTIAAALECVVSGHVYLPDELAETMPDLHFELPVQAHRRIVAETLGGQAVKPSFVRSGNGDYSQICARADHTSSGGSA